MTSVNVGNVEIVQFLDLNFAFPYSAAFPDIPEDQWAPYHELYPGSTKDGDWSTNAQCYAIRSTGRTILVDTDVGPGPNEWLGGTTGNLIADMRSKGVEPESVETVIFTHLHPDHVGWSIADGKPVLEQARYLVPQADWEFFRSEAQASDNPHVGEQIAPLEGLGVLELVSGEQEITPELTLLPAPGHTPGHQSLAISSAGELAFILGDLALHPAQIEETEWNAGFDGDGPTAIATRKQIMERLEGDGSLVAAGHFSAPGLGRIVRAEGMRIFRAL